MAYGAMSENHHSIIGLSESIAYIRIRIIPFLCSFSFHGTAARESSCWHNLDYKVTEFDIKSRCNRSPNLGNDESVLYRGLLLDATNHFVADYCSIALSPYVCQYQSVIFSALAYKLHRIYTLLTFLLINTFECCQFGCNLEEVQERLQK